MRAILAIVLAFRDLLEIAFPTFLVSVCFFGESRLTSMFFVFLTPAPLRPDLPAYTYLPASRASSTTSPHLSTNPLCRIMSVTFEHCLCSSCFWDVTKTPDITHLGAVHTKTHTYCIILADHPHRSWKRTFLISGLRVEKSKNVALPLSYGWRIHILSETMTPSPHPSTSEPRDISQ